MIYVGAAVGTILGYLFGRKQIARWQMTEKISEWY